MAVPMARREERDEDRDPERRADPVDDPAQVVAPELIRPEVVMAGERRRVREPGDRIDVFEVDLVEAVRRQLLREDRDEREQDQDHEADDGGLVPEEAYPRVRPLAARLELDARLVCELCVGARSAPPRRRIDAPDRAGLHARLDHAVTRARISHSGRAGPGSRTRCRR